MDFHTIDKNILQKELDKLRHDILTMASHVEEDISKALTALQNGDKVLAKEVKANDAIVNSMQLQIEDSAITMIATQAPVAGDLRELVTIFKIAGGLERIGDYAVHLAKAAIKFSGIPAFRSLVHVEKMAETGREMLHSAISAFIARDADAARNAAKVDAVIDAEHKFLTEEVLGLMKEQKDNVKKIVRLLNTSSYLERMGDHITNICESIIYMIEAKHEELNS